MSNIFSSRNRYLIIKLMVIAKICSSQAPVTSDSAAIGNTTEASLFFIKSVLECLLACLLSLIFTHATQALKSTTRTSMNPIASFLMHYAYSSFGVLIADHSPI